MGVGRRCLPLITTATLSEHAWTVEDLGWTEL
jgi:hypothetical protein